MAKSNGSKIVMAEETYNQLCMDAGTLEAHMDLLNVACRDGGAVNLRKHTLEYALGALKRSAIALHKGLGEAGRLAGGEDAE